MGWSPSQRACVNALPVWFAFAAPSQQRCSRESWRGNTLIWAAFFQSSSALQRLLLRAAMWLSCLSLHTRCTRGNEDRSRTLQLGCRCTALMCSFLSPSIPTTSLSWLHINSWSCSIVANSNTCLGCTMTPTSGNGQQLITILLGCKSIHSSMHLPSPLTVSEVLGAQYATQMEGHTRLTAPSFNLVQCRPLQFRTAPLPLLIHSSLAPGPTPPSKRPRPFMGDYCILFNKHQGNCPYGDNCQYIHKCSNCLQPGHPVGLCPARMPRTSN